MRLSIVLLCVIGLASGQFVLPPNPHTNGTGKYDEHEALFDLVPGDAVTHTAVASGPWTAAGTWDNGIPGDDARVFIPDGVAVTYAGELVARLKTVLVAGELHFDPAARSTMVVDTFVGARLSLVTIGTADTPVQGSGKVEITFPGGPIDVAWDPFLLSRGFITHGTLRVHGQEKTAHVKVAVDPVADDTSLQLASEPVNWQVGDTLVVAGSRYTGYNWDNDLRVTRHFPSEDEVVTVTAISGTVVEFSPPLQRDHGSPRTDRPDLKISVACLSRSVVFSSEDQDAAPTHERAHFMAMHTNDVDVRYAEFAYMGRTDKRVSKDVPARDVTRFDVIEPTSNVKGRYAFHFHRSGIPDHADQRDTAAMAVGNSAHHNFGWCFVHHDSNAVFSFNVAYDCFGAGFSAETGNEVGSWTDNIAILSQGIGWGNPKNMVNLDEFDTGKSGDCFWFQSRMVRSVRNIAASCDSGFAYFHRGNTGVEGAGPLSFHAGASPWPDALGLGAAVGADDAPIRGFVDNECFASNHGVFVVKANPHQGHDLHSHLKRLKAWSVRTGAFIEYTAHYFLEDFDVVGFEAGLYSDRPKAGVHIGNNAGDIIFRDPTITGFEEGLEYIAPSNPDGPVYWDRSFVVVGASFVDIANNEYLGFNESHDLVLATDDLVEGRFDLAFSVDFTYKEGYPDPDARHVAVAGTKTDSITTIALPPSGDTGPDNYEARMAEVIQRLAAGYYQNDAGENVFCLPDYYTDRGTGEVHKIGTWVTLDANMDSYLGSIHYGYTDATDMGPLSIPDAAPTVADDTASTTANVDVTIDVLANDNDPDGDTLTVGGIIQPDYGVVYKNGDGTVTYRPDLHYEGPDSFRYWATDSHCNYVPATVTLTVGPAPPPPPPGVTTSTDGTDTSGSGTTAGGSGTTAGENDEGDNVSSANMLRLSISAVLVICVCIVLV